MMDRKKKLRLIQFSLLITGIFILYLTYYGNEVEIENEIISKSVKEKVKKQIKRDNEDENDVFYNIEYSGLDLNGNRYLLKSDEAYLDKLMPELVNMKTVYAIFYFKDNTELYVWSDTGIYNNKTLDMNFTKNVKAEYLKSKLFAEKAEYSNTNNYLSVYENVRVDDIRGNLIADKLLFDITKQKLNITSFNNGKINAKVKLNEKRF